MEVLAAFFVVALASFFDKFNVVTDVYKFQTQMAQIKVPVFRIS